MYLFNGELPEKGHSDGDGRVEMGTGDMTDRIYHDHNSHPKRQTNSWKRHRAIHFIQNN